MATPFLSLQLRGSHAFASAAVLVLAACGKSEDDPSAGQTGSPVVSPDYDGPAPFRPPAEQPPSGGGSPELPRRPLTEPERTASFGSWLYAATPRGLFALDTSANDAAALQLLPHVQPEWLGVDGTALYVIASTLAEEPSEVEQGALTRLYRLDLASDPAAPPVVASIDLPGRFQQARLSEGRLVTLSAAWPAPVCTPEWGHFTNAYAPDRLVVSDLRAEGSSVRVAQELAVEAEGYIETENAFVLIDGGYWSKPALATVVEIGADALSAWPSLDLGGEVLPRAAMAQSGNRLAFLRSTASGIELAVHERAVGAASVLPVPLVAGAYSWDGANAARFAGPFLLAPAAPDTGGAGLVIDWARDGGPAVSGELPGDLLHLQAIGERWLGWGSDRSVLFSIGAQGTFELQRELPPPPGSFIEVDAYDAEAEQRLLLPYLAASDATRSSYAVASLDLAALDAAGSMPAWLPGSTLHGSPAVTYYGAGFPAAALHFARTASGLYGLTSAGEALSFQWLIESIDVDSPESAVVALGDRAVAASLRGSELAVLRADHRGSRSVQLGGPDSSGVIEAVPLAHGAERLQPFGEGWLTSSLHYSNACFPGQLEVSEGAPCLPEGTPALGLIGRDPLRVISEVPLPEPDTQATAGRVTPEWLELIVQGEHLAVLEHRGVDCRNAGDCEALGIEYDPARMGGNRSERWLHPFDVASATFAPPLHLKNVDGYGWLSASELQVADAAALSLFTPLAMADDGVHVERARIELLRLPSLDADGVAAVERVTVAGYPIYVTGGLAITLEPKTELGPGGASPAVLAHRLSVDGGVAHFEQTLELPPGHAGHLWAQSRGYVLLIGDDRCAERSSTLVALQLEGSELREAGRLQLPGTSWRLAQATDELVLLTRQIDALAQHAVVTASGDELSLGSLETHLASLPVSVSGGELRFAPEP